MAIMPVMDTIPTLCCTCRFGTMIPAVVAATRTSVFWCRQGVPRVADRRNCPCYARGSPLEAVTAPLQPPRAAAPATTRPIDRPGTGGLTPRDADPSAPGWGGVLTPSG
jgi:hypothetical protein